MEGLQRILARGEEGRAQANQAMLALTERIAHAVGHDARQPAADAAHRREPRRRSARRCSGWPSSARAASTRPRAAHLRNIELYLQRLLADAEQGRAQATAELRNDLRLLTRTVAALAESSRGSDGAWRCAAARGGNGLDAWPGYVDALSTLLMVIIFVLLVFVLAQAFLSVALTGRDQALDRVNRQLAELTDMLSLERGHGARAAAVDRPAQPRAAAADGARDTLTSSLRRCRTQASRPRPSATRCAPSATGCRAARRRRAAGAIRRGAGERSCSAGRRRRRARRRGGAGDGDSSTQLAERAAAAQLAARRCARSLPRCSGRSPSSTRR